MHSANSDRKIPHHCNWRKKIGLWLGQVWEWGPWCAQRVLTPASSCWHRLKKQRVSNLDWLWPWAFLLPDGWWRCICVWRGRVWSAWARLCSSKRVQTNEALFQGHGHRWLCYKALLWCVPYVLPDSVQACLRDWAEQHRPARRRTRSALNQLSCSRWKFIWQRYRGDFMWRKFICRKQQRGDVCLGAV